MATSPINRRFFATGAALGCFATMSAAAFAQVSAAARRSGRPLLTAASLNAAIPGPNDPHHSEVLLEAAQDLRVFLRARFTLTASQEAEIASISAGQMQALQRGLRTAAAEHRAVSVTIVTSGVGNTGAENVGPPCVSQHARGACLSKSVCVNAGQNPVVVIWRRSETRGDADVRRDVP